MVTLPFKHMNISRFACLGRAFASLKAGVDSYSVLATCPPNCAAIRIFTCPNVQIDSIMVDKDDAAVVNSLCDGHMRPEPK